MGSVGGAGGIGAPWLTAELISIDTITPAANSTSVINVYQSSPAITAGQTVFLKVMGTGGIYLNMGALTVDAISDISSLELRSDAGGITNKSNIFDTSTTTSATPTASVPAGGMEVIVFDFGDIAARNLFAVHVSDAIYMSGRIEVSDNDADWVAKSTTSGTSTPAYYWSEQSFRYLRWFVGNSDGSPHYPASYLNMLGILSPNETLDVFEQHTAAEDENYPILILNKAGAITWFMFKGEI